MRKFVVLIALFFSFALMAKEYSPAEITNPNKADRRVYVADPANLVGAGAEAAANTTLWNLRKQTGAEVVMVVVPNTGNYSREEFATKLFDLWGVGKSDKDNGAIILIVPDQKEAWIATGYGLEGIIPDISAAKILQRSVVPYMKEGKIDDAVTAVAADVAQVLSDPEAAAELKSNKKEAWEENPESDVTAQDFIFFIVIVVCGFAFFAFVKFFYDTNKLRRADRYTSARAWHDNQSTYLLLAIFSLGLGALPYWLAKRKYKNSRNKPLDCPTCRAKMYKLNEEEDNQMLNASQDLEERLNSVDYDVWVCPQCGTVERYAFPNKDSIYEECPHCHTKAMTMVQDHTLQAPTTRRSGIGERIYECKYCHNHTRRRYTIPQKADGTAAALAAGAILGAGRGGGGGGFGGGFGGGRTGGGGGGARW